MEAWKFLTNFAKDRQIASIAQTSKGAVKKICDQINFARPLVVVEYGPGLGPVSEEVAARMSPTSRLVLIERNDEFYKHLKDKFKDDARVIVVQGLAQDVQKILKEHDFESADYIISSIPFSFFSKETADAIVKSTAQALRTHGIFIVFQFTPAVKKYLGDHFARTAKFTIWPNLPPLTVYLAQTQ